MAITYLAAMSGGMMLVLGLLRLRHLEVWYVRLAAVVSLGLSAASLGWIVLFDGWWADTYAGIAAVGLLIGLAGSAIVLVTAGSIRSAELLYPVLWTGAVATLFATMIWSYSRGLIPEWPSSRLAASCLGLTASGLLLGAVILMWMLAHAYLAPTEMTMAPLRRVVRLMYWALGARLGLVLAVLGLGHIDAMGEPSRVVLGSWQGMLLWRVGGGLALPLIAVAMISRWVGKRPAYLVVVLLYGISLLVFAGEFSAHELMRRTRWPL